MYRISRLRGNRMKYIFLVMMMLALAGCGVDKKSGLTEHTSKTATKQSSSGVDKERSFTEPEILLPSSGMLHVYSGKERIAPFEINAGSGEHYYVKLVDIRTGRDVLILFVRSNSRIQVDVPLGVLSVER